MCFWTTESLELMNILTYGGVETASYPLPIYHRVFRRFFTAQAPSAIKSVALAGAVFYARPSPFVSSHPRTRHLVDLAANAASSTGC